MQALNRVMEMKIVLRASRWLTGIAAGALLVTADAAAAPRVVTDIAPVHSLVARVMQGAGEPALVIPPGASPHGYAMRPSEARLLSEAEVVFWVGPALAPWFGETLASLADGAASVELWAVEGVHLLPIREGGAFEGHGDHGGHDHGGHDHGGHAPEGHGHDEGHADGQAAAGHETSGPRFDEHLWLDPRNARAWLSSIAETLAAADPANAGLYRDNAAAAVGELDRLATRIDGLLQPVRGVPYVVFHDAYQYFEDRFGISAAGAISFGDATKPSAARIAEIRETIARLDARCVFSEPQFEPRVVSTVIEGTNAGTGTLDPIGASLPLGPSLYPELLEGLARSLRDCLGPTG